MPELAAAVRAQGGFTAADVEPWPDHDWTIPTDAATLRHRVRATPTRTYGHAKTDPPRYNTDGTVKR